MRAIGVVALLTVATTTHAFTETFLVAIPIADVLAHREVAYTFSATGTERRISKGYAWAGGVEFGLADRLEFGFDSDLLGGTLGNAKFQALSGNNWAVSMGINQIDANAISKGTYIVGRYDFPGFRLHGGVVRTDKARTVLGVDGDLKRGYSYMIDTTVAAHGYTWGALNVPVSDLVVTVAAGVPYDHHDGVQHMIGLTLVRRY